MTNQARPVKVLHVVGRMNRGGVETWLMRLLRIMERESWQMDFLVGDPTHASFDEEIIQRGSKILLCPPVRNPILYAINLFKTLKMHGPYDVIHSHVHHFSGALLFVAWFLGIPVRIAHSHCDSLLVDSKASFSRKIYLKIMKKLIDRFATIGLAASNEAKTALTIGGKRNLSWHVSHCGIDLSEFSHITNKALLRKEWGIAENSLVLGHVGNFHLAKNHQFLLYVAHEVFKRKPDSRLILVGEGTMQNAIRTQAKQLGIESKIIFAGTRPDVPSLLGIMDVFLFPSIFEGLGLVVIEAQAAGLPIVIADSVPKETEIVAELFHWMSLSDPPEIWAQQCIQAYEKSPGLCWMDTNRKIGVTSFNIVNNWQELQRIYKGEQAEIAQLT